MPENNLKTVVRIYSDEQDGKPEAEGRLVFRGAWDRTLTEAEVLSMLVDPYQILRRPNETT